MSGTATPQKTSTSTPVPEYVEQAWQKAERPDHDADLEWAAAENGDEAEEWECVACGKTFRSEAAWDSHERSKKHIQAVELLKEAMLEENEEFGLDPETNIEVGGDGEEAEEPPDSPPSEVFATPEEFAAAAELSIPIGSQDQAGLDKGSEYAPQKGKKKKGKKKSRAPSPEPVQKVNIEQTGKGRHLSESADLPEEVHAPSVLAEDAATLADGAATPVETETTTAALPELSKREKRRAREAAKKAKEQEAANAPQVSGALLCSK